MLFDDAAETGKHMILRVSLFVYWIVVSFYIEPKLGMHLAV